MTDIITRSRAEIHEALLACREIALLDVREEDPHAQAHPLFAANLPFAKLELEAYTRLPRLGVPVVVFDAGEGLALPAAQRLKALGYTDVALLQGGLDGWRESGGEIFQDVNAPSKAFGELVESERHTPSLSAETVQKLLDDQADVVVLDARRFDEYRTMNIPGSVSVPGAELVLRARALAPNPETQIIVNCAGRTRSIIGTQSLVNAGVPNRVAALRNGTIGWLLAGQQLAHGSDKTFPESAGLDQASLKQSREQARATAKRAGVNETTLKQALAWGEENAYTARTTYLFDVRDPHEYDQAHVPGFRSTPGGQLVQETEMFAPVRGARVVLFDTDGVRANMTGSWLAQMNVETFVVTSDKTSSHAETDLSALSESGPWKAKTVTPPRSLEISAGALAARLAEKDHRTLVLDFTASAAHVKAHIPGAYWLLRSRLATDLSALLSTLTHAERIVVTCGSSALARFVAPEVAALSGKPVEVLSGGTSAWVAAGFATQTGEATLASPRIDRYRRPYEGTDAPREAMNAYLEWEFGLVAQLGRDGSHGFKVI